VDVTATRVRAGALELACLVCGRDADPTVVLVHGNGAHARWWDAVAPALVPGWRLVVPDLRGHGESAWPDEPAYHVADFADDLVAVVAALVPGRFALVGHSMGGRVALWYAAHHPDRVRGLGLLDTRLDLVEPEVAARYRGRTGGERAGRGYPSREAALAAFRFVPDERGVPADVVAHVAAHAIVERGPGDWAYRFDRAVLRLDGDGAGDLHRLLPRIAFPTFVASARESWVLPAASRERIVAALPRGEGREFPGGHHFLLSHADEVGAALRRFLDGLPR
jgi:pimeloyl-ACP methyl ester carboxylesterase